ncbi:MAG: 1-acyl-sn-glycerol-3-phosphate acyltransferase [Lachnospiraceae bacterium]|nr:1-acyl-sn-glycerol-3-phosphate acyltransferase [Lachnospiraceae bacterium]
MRRANQEIPSWILSNKEECRLSLEDKKAYFEKLREFCGKRKLCTTTPGALSVAPKLKKMTEKIARKVSGVLAGGEIEVVSDGQENIPDGAVIFAMSHQGIMDNFVWMPENPRHCILLHHGDVNKLLILAQLNTGLVLVSKKPENANSRINNKLDMISILLRGHCMHYSPEGTWNLSPNKLHLPMSYGFLEVAQKAGVPVVPMVIEYTYDTAMPKERITKAHIRYGKSITVGLLDSLKEKLHEYEEAVSTMRWKLIEEKGIYQRKNITNLDYINYMKGNLKTLELGQASLEAERQAMRGGNDEFYVFHHINDVPWDAWGELKGTEEVERLKKINRIHGI